MSRFALWRRWVFYVSAGELAGFAVPTLAGVVLWALDAPAGVAFALAVPAGAAEGAILGFAQSLVLAGELARLSRRHWIAASALAAALAWVLGLTLSRLPDRLDDSPALLGVAAALLGTGLLLSLGTAQWLVLRRHVRRASLWIAANALAWLVALGLVVPVMSVFLTEDTTTAGAIAIGVSAGLAMGVLVAAVTGAFLVRLLRPEGS